MKKTVPVTNLERAFDVGELFFSTTDNKGVITSCNEVFLRVAEYQAQEVLGMPHNIVRHPHMPRCVFQLLWQYLLAGRSIGAYVKNRSKSGAYYWVFALAMPTPEGFISIRLKPTSPILQKIAPAYEKLLEIEQRHQEDRRKGMLASSEALVATLQELGFKSYDEFMAVALQAEIDARYHQLHSAQSQQDDGLKQAFSNLGELQTLKANLVERNSFFGNFAATLTKSALNLGVQAAHLSDGGRALGVICNEIANIAGQVRTESEVISKENSTLATHIEEACFGISFAALLMEMISFFNDEQVRLKADEAAQIAMFGKTFDDLGALLADCFKESLSRASRAQGQLCRVFSSYEIFIEQLSKILLSIQFSYVTGRSLAASLSGTERFSLQLAAIIETAEQARSDINFIRSQVQKSRSIVNEWALSDRETSYR